jgi:hypothetical protein
MANLDERFERGYWTEVFVLSRSDEGISFCVEYPSLFIFSKGKFLLSMVLNVLKATTGVRCTTSSLIDSFSQCYSAINFVPTDVLTVFSDLGKLVARQFLARNVLDEAQREKLRLSRPTLGKLNFELTVSTSSINDVHFEIDGSTSAASSTRLSAKLTIDNKDYGKCTIDNNDLLLVLSSPDAIEEVNLLNCGKLTLHKDGNLEFTGLSKKYRLGGWRCRADLENLVNQIKSSPLVYVIDKACNVY